MPGTEWLKIGETAYEVDRDTCSACGSKATHPGLVFECGAIYFLRKGMLEILIPCPHAHGFLIIQTQKLKDIELKLADLDTELQKMGMTDVR